MATKIRLQRGGRKSYAFYSIVIADVRAPRDGKYTEKIGTYNPNTNPATIDLNFERALHWVECGAQPTDTVRNILSLEGVMLMKHLNGGVRKGAFDEAAAQAKFEAWKQEKDSKAAAAASKNAESKKADAAARLEAEKKVNEKIAEKVAEKKAAAAQAQAEAAAKEAGADYVGLDEYIEKIKGGWTDIDVIITMPSIMGKIGALGRVLGPRGLMPNPKSGTVTMDVAKAVKEVKQGKIDFKVDKAGIIHTSIGKVSMTPEQIYGNAKEFINTVIKLKPAAAKGTYIKSIFISSTMSKGIKIDPKSVE